jgi:endonuclease G
MNRLTTRLTAPLAPLLALLLLAGPTQPSCAAPDGQEPGAGRNARFGLPGPAKADPGEREAYLIERPQYVLSYNGRTRTPNWVCWQLRQEDVGHALRGAFEPDPDLPKGFARVTSHAYDGSGFDS